MLKLNYVVIDFEGFKHKNEPYLIEEISVFGPSYQDTLLLKPQCPIDQVPVERRRTYLRCSKHLYGLDWNSRLLIYLPILYQFENSLSKRSVLCKRRSQVQLLTQSFIQNCRLEIGWLSERN